MKKIAVIMLVSIMAFTGTVYAENKKHDNKTMLQEEKTDKVVNDFFNNIEKTLEDSTKKVADEIKSLNK